MSIKSKIKTSFREGDEHEYMEETEEIDEMDKPAGQSKTQSPYKDVNVTSMQHTTSKVVLGEARTDKQAQECRGYSVGGRAVVINLQRVDQQQAKRIVDFLSGTVYAVNGDIQKLGSETFLCTPDNVNVSGSISESLASSEDEFQKGW